MKDDEIRRRIDEARRAKERAGELRHDPRTVAEVLRRVAVLAANAAPLRSDTAEFGERR